MQVLRQVHGKADISKMADGEAPRRTSPVKTINQNFKWMKTALGKQRTAAKKHPESQGGH